MDRDHVLAKLARRQQGVFTRWQLVSIGFTDDAIDRRLSSERLDIVHRGVLSIVPRQLMTRPAFFMAAVLAGGEVRCLSRRSAAALWGLRQSASAVVDITVARRVGKRSGIRAHRVPLAIDEHTVVDGIPVTTPPRTVFDLAGDLQPHELRRALEQMEVLRLWDRLTPADLLERYPGRRGTATLRSGMAAGALGARVTRSELERRFLVLVEDAGLALPDTNALVESRERDYEADCLWRRERGDRRARRPGL